MICLTKPALATATLKHPNPSGEEERSRRGTHSAAGGEKQQSADQTDEPPPKIEKSTGPNGVSYRRAMRSAGPRPSSSSSLSPLPSRERFLASCLSFLSECRAAGWPDARHLCGDGGGASGRRWKKGETVGHLGWGFGRVPDAAGGSWLGWVSRAPGAFLLDGSTSVCLQFSTAPQSTPFVQIIISFYLGLV